MAEESERIETEPGDGAAEEVEAHKLKIDDVTAHSLESEDADEEEPED